MKCYAGDQFILSTNLINYLTIVGEKLDIGYSLFNIGYSKKAVSHIGLTAVLFFGNYSISYYVISGVSNSASDF